MTSRKASDDFGNGIVAYRVGDVGDGAIGNGVGDIGGGVVGEDGVDEVDDGFVGDGGRDVDGGVLGGLRWQRRQWCRGRGRWRHVLTVTLELSSASS